jgi:hypothetical protein
MAVRSLLKTILAVTTLCLSLNASANLIFDFKEKLKHQHSATYNINGFELTVEAFDPSDNNASNKINRSDSGLGVHNNPNSNSIGTGEYLVFTFTELFYGHLNITFGNWGVNRNKPNRTDVAGIALNGGVSTTFGAGNGPFTSDDAAIKSFTVMGISGNGFRVANVELVPEPSALAILGLGLLGLGIRRFKKS